MSDGLIVSQIWLATSLLSEELDVKVLSLVFGTVVLAIHLLEKHAA